MMYSRSFKTSFGSVTVYCDGDAVTEIKLDNVSNAVTGIKLANASDPVSMTKLANASNAATEAKLANTSDPVSETKLANEKDTRSHPLLIETERQLQEYFLGKRREFDLKLNLKGTEFQRRVWQTLLKIPYGDTISYKSLAIMVDNKNAYRAVAMANHRNHVPIIVPCHRVISADGSLGGYAFGTALKQHLLDIERGVLNE